MYELALIRMLNVTGVGKDIWLLKCTLRREIACGIKGHLQAVCFRNRDAHQLDEILLMKHSEDREKFHATLKVNNIPIMFEIDSNINGCSRDYYELQSNNVPFY